MRVAVARLAAHGLAQPVDGRRIVLLPPVGVAQVERVVGLRGIGVDRLVEEIRGPSVLRRRAAPQLNHAEVVEDLGRAGLVPQRLQSRKRVVVPREPDLGHGGLELRPRRVRRGGRHRQRRIARLEPLARHRVRAAKRQPRAVEGRVKRQRLLEKADLRGGRLGQQPLDELLERRQRRPRFVEAGRGDAGRHQPPRGALDDGQQIVEPAALVELEADAARVDANRLHVEREGPIHAVPRVP